MIMVTEIERKYLDIILLLLIVIAIFLLAYDIYTYFQDGKKCMSSPLTFGLKNWENKLKSNASCFCNFADPCAPTITFDSSNIILNYKPFDITQCP